jgi:molybdate transport system substrate-binding protein
MFGYGWALLVAAVLLIPSAAHARDLVVYGEPTLEMALRWVGQLWQARSATRINVFVAPSKLSYEQIDRGARCDVIFAPAGAATDSAASRKIIDAATVRRLFRNGLSLVGTDQTAAPAGNLGVDEFSKLIAGKSLAIASPDRDLAGAHAVALLRKIGIVVDENKDVSVAESTAGVVEFLRTGKARFGIVFATDAAANSFKLAVPLPDQPAIEYVMAQARDPQLEVQTFMAFLRSPEAKAALQSAGLDSVDDGKATRERGKAGDR